MPGVLSLVPGLGQIYNKQYGKRNIIYGFRIPIRISDWI